MKTTTRNGWMARAGVRAAGAAALLLAVGVAGGVSAASAEQSGSGAVVGASARGSASAPSLDAARREKAQKVIERAIVYLRTQQDPATGGWRVPDANAAESGGRASFHMPAITGLVVNGMLMDPGVSADDPSVRAAVRYMVSKRQPDGGFYDRILPSYNTSIVLSALARVDDPEVRALLRPTQDYLRGLQYSEIADSGRGGDEAPMRVDREHPFYGGVGYGRHGRPDGSNLNMMLQALHDSGVSADDPAFERALVFLRRTQMHHAVNPMPWAEGSTQGGFIYATVENAESVEGPAGQSQAGTIEESLDDGTVVSRLRAYGSMTYAGFKSFAYAGLDKDDQRVRLAREWIGKNYTLEENPGMGASGFYYYILTFSRALDAWGDDTVRTLDEEAGKTEDRNWRADLVDRLAELQQEDGSFRSLNDRWMENDPVLITAYSLIAIEYAVGNAD